MKPRATFLIPYFGTLPEWFHLYLASAGAQGDFSWIIFTDDRTAFDLPLNVTTRYMSFEDYRRTMEDRLDIPLEELSTFHPYLLCDLKPFLGHIHEDEIEGVEYWGFTDIDLIVGDLAKFLMPAIDKGIDLISTHDDRIAGHLTLVRNTPKLRARCFDIPEWRAHLTSGLHPSLCEYHFAEEFFSLRRKLGWWRGDQFYALMRRLRLHKLMSGKRYCEEMYTTPLTDIEWPDGSLFWDHPLEWEWRNGQVRSLETGMEIPYIHFMNFKLSRWLKTNVNKAVEESGYEPRSLPEGMAVDVAPWEALDSILLNSTPDRAIEWIRVGLRGIEVG